MKKIYMIASFGDFNKLPLGGGMTAARRLLTTLKELGYDVTALHRHPPMAKRHWIRILQFGFWMSIDLVSIFFRLLFRSRKNCITLYMGYLGPVPAPLDCSMARLTHILGYYNVMYLAGGGTEKVHDQGGLIQRFLEKRTLRAYKLVMVEGMENIKFVHRLAPKTETFYLPNFTEEGFAPTIYPVKPSGRWNIFYLGRVDKTKNVLLGIEVFNQLAAKYENVYYTIVGGGPDDYCMAVQKAINESPYNKRINRIGRSSHDDIKKMMGEQHFFLFPSQEPREGHSNALNEAMSFGLVPIASDNNFLPSIVGNERLIVHELIPMAYAEKISSIIESGEYDPLSREMYERVRNQFVQSIVGKNLKNKIDSI